MNRVGDIKNKNILLLQGPMGDFFKRLDNHFRSKGAKTFRIGFNVGDWFFSNKDNYTAFRGKKEEWREFFIDYVKKNKIDKIFLFGDCRFYQNIAIQESQRLGIETYVFEEGYIRPDFITMEKWGVNNFSKISRDPKFYLSLPDSILKEKKILPANNSYFKMAFSASIYYVLAKTFLFKYPYYEHHRELAPLKEAFYGIRSFYRKIKYKTRDEKITQKLKNELSKKYYFVPLQTSSDFQIREHSKYNNIEEFIEEVLTSFAKFAPKDKFIVFKHHPMDRGRKDYTKFIKKLSKKLNIEDRVIVTFETHLPTALSNAIGTITINSTVGLSSIYHKTPTITLGNALYDIEGLTCKGMSLDDFWVNYKKPNYELYKKFRAYLIENTQLNGGFYGLFPRDLE